jgi:hypothetical protein
MPQLSIDGVDKRFRGFLKPYSWTLCIGAGTTIGIMPSWRDLCRLLVNASFDLALDGEAFDRVMERTSWGFEAWIQASLNRHLAADKTTDEFLQLLEEVLYAQLRRDSDEDHLSKQVFTSFLSPHLLREDEFHKVLDFFRNRYPNASVLLLSEFLTRPEVLNRRPRSIITLNYDVIMDALLRMNEISRHASQIGRHEFPPEAFKRVTSPLTRWGEHIPIFHLHGSLTPRPPRAKLVVGHDTRHILVGPETTYAGISGATASWGQSAFLHHAVSDTLVFVGHSMADPNIRRWLAWSSQAVDLEVHHRTGNRTHRLPHFWFAVRRSSQQEARILEYSLQHLGVRVAWLKNWSELIPALSNLLATD